jgi:superfamily II DNA or RNA helicase
MTDIAATSGYYQRHRSDVKLDDDALSELRPGQRGAVFAMRSWATAPDDGVAILGLPTGYGKSELIALAPFLFTSCRVLIIAPSVVVRGQLAARVRAQEHLRSQGVIPGSLPQPLVLDHVGRIESPSDWERFEEYDVVVSHTQSVSPAGKPVIDPPHPDLFDLVVFDEAHHLGAPSWVGVRTAFPEAVAIGFTATPYRRDRRSLPGRTIFQYPIDKAVDEGFFVPITYTRVAADATAEGRDRAVAEAAILELRRRDAAAGQRAARLLVRADTVQRAQTLGALYQDLDPEVVLEVITHQTTMTQLAAATARLQSGESSGVAFVGVLGEGFDLPSLKIAAYHNPHRSLPVTIQFAGRVARTEYGASASAEGPEEHAVLIAAVDDHPAILAELHRDGQRWDRLIPELARDLGEGSSRAWTVFSPDTADMADAFTIENFRAFMLADVYRLSSAPEYELLAANLAELRLATPEEGAAEVASAGGTAPRDSAYSVKVLQEGTCFAALLAREHQRQWLQATPSGQQEYEYIVLAIEPHQDGKTWWLCVRSTLPPDMTERALARLFGPSIQRPSRSELAQYRGDAWPHARFTGLGKRAIHPVVAGVLSYETGAGRSVDQAVSLDDRALNEIGHAIGVVPAGARFDRTQIGIAMDKRRVWQTGYARLNEYAIWAASLCREIEGGVPVGQLGGLRIADSPLSPTAKPIAAMLAPFFDVNWDAEYQIEGMPAAPFADLELAPLARQTGADIDLSIVRGGKTLATITYAADGQLLRAPGEFRRRGHSETLADRLQRHPISVFFSDGSVMRGPGGCIAPLGDDTYFAIADEPRLLATTPVPLSADNRFAVLDATTVTLPEKDAASTAAILASLGSVKATTPPSSLFQFVVRQALVEKADFVYCDDGTNEVADFILGWLAHPQTGRPHIRLVHCKAMQPAERKRIAAGGDGVRGSGLKEAEEIGQQTIRSIAYLLRPADTMRFPLERRALAHPERYIVGTVDTFDDVVNRDPLARTTEVWSVHPGLSRQRLLQPRGRPLRTLFAAIRARAVDARADVAVIGRA